MLSSSLVPPARDHRGRRRFVVFARDSLFINTANIKATDLMIARKGSRIVTIANRRFRRTVSPSAHCHILCDLELKQAEFLPVMTRCDHYDRDVCHMWLSVPIVPRAVERVVLRRVVVSGRKDVDMVCCR